MPTQQTKKIFKKHDKRKPTELLARAKEVATDSKVNKVDIIEPKGDEPAKIRITLDNELQSEMTVACVEGWEEEVVRNINKFKNKQIPR